MNIFITAAWSNHVIVKQVHGSLTRRGHKVRSFLNAEYIADGESFKTLREWKESASSKKSFNYEVKWSTTSDLVIYIGQGDATAWALVGLARGAGVPVVGIADGHEEVVTMRDLVQWVNGDQLIDKVEAIAKRLTRGRIQYKVQS